MKANVVGKVERADSRQVSGNPPVTLSERLETLVGACADHQGESKRTPMLRPGATPSKAT